MWRRSWRDKKRVYGCCLQAVTVQAVSVTTGKQYLFIVGPAGLCFAAGQTAFDRLLQDRAREGLNFSKHAAKRMNERGIAFDSQLMSDLEHAVEGARKKGAEMWQ